MLKAYLSAQSSSLSAFIIKKARGRRLNTKGCGSESAMFLLVQSTKFNNDISKTRRILIVIQSRNYFLSQRGALQPLSVFIATNSPCSR